MISIDKNDKSTNDNIILINSPSYEQNSNLNTSKDMNLIKSDDDKKEEPIQNGKNNNSINNNNNGSPNRQDQSTDKDINLLDSLNPNNNNDHNDNDNKNEKEVKFSVIEYETKGKDI